MFIDFKIGNKAKLNFQISEFRSYEIFCSIKWIEYDRIALFFPAEHNDLKKFLMEGRELIVEIRTDKGIFTFESIVIDSPYDIDFVIELPEAKEKIQRRCYLRVPIVLDLNLTYSNINVKAKTINIGGGGIRFEVNQEDLHKNIECGDIWCFSLLNEEWKAPVNGLGVIIFTEAKDDKIVSVIQFNDIDELDRNKIIKECFEYEAKVISLQMKRS